MEKPAKARRKARRPARAAMPFACCVPSCPPAVAAKPYCRVARRPCAAGPNERARGQPLSRASECRTCVPGRGRGRASSVQRAACICLSLRC